MADPLLAVQVVKHAYTPKQATKFRGAAQNAYPKKNWSSVMLINCAHFAWRKVNQAYINSNTGAHLHRFEFIPEDKVGSLPDRWNHLVIDQDDRPDASLIHYTNGTPCFDDYKHCPQSLIWHKTRRRMNEPISQP